MSVAAGALSGVSRGRSLVAVSGLVTAVTALAAEHRFYGARASVVVARGAPSLWLPGLEHQLSSCGEWA